MEKLIVTVKELAPLLDTTPGVIYRMVKKLEGEDENNVNLRQHVKGN